MLFADAHHRHIETAEEKASSSPRQRCVEGQLPQAQHHLQLSKGGAGRAQEAKQAHMCPASSFPTCHHHCSPRWELGEWQIRRSRRLGKAEERCRVLALQQGCCCCRSVCQGIVCEAPAGATSPVPPSTPHPCFLKACVCHFQSLNWFAWKRPLR